MRYGSAEHVKPVLIYNNIISLIVTKPDTFEFIIINAGKCKRIKSPDLCFGTGKSIFTDGFYFSWHCLSAVCIKYCTTLRLM